MKSSLPTLERFQRLELRARRIVEGLLMGRHASPFHGAAIEFASHREYSPGDELRHLDWKVWWKTQRLYVKQHEEETHLPCTLVVDASRSMRYGDPESGSKFEHGSLVALCLALLLQRQQDAVGLLTFHSRVLTQLPPRTHPQQFDAIVRALEQTAPDEAADVGTVFRQLARQIRRRGLVVLISDLFADRESLAAALEEFRVRRHEVLVCQVLHGDELSFPFQGMTLFRGLEQTVDLETEPGALRQAYLAELERFLGSVRDLCAQAAADYLLVDMRQPLEAVLANYLHSRERSRVRARRR